MQNFGYLFAAYTIIFAVIFFYVLFIWRRQARLEGEVRAMEQRLRELEYEGVSASAADSSKVEK